MKNRVGTYIRVSTEEQARIVEGSLVSQRARLNEYVEAQNRRQAGWGEVVDSYCDEARSGKDMNRPEFQRLIADVRSGRVNLVLATELSRLSRSTRDFCGLWDLFKDCGASFVTLREQFDTTTAAGQMMVFNLINFAQFERMQTAERISASWASRAKRGLWNGGQIPLGYDKNSTNKGILIPNVEEAKTVNTVFRTFLETESLRETCEKLSEMGIRTKHTVGRSGRERGGTHFTVSGLHHFLTNQALIGVREMGKAKGQIETCQATWPGIVDAQVFARTQEVLKANHQRRKPEEWKTFAYPLTERVVCGECGKTMGGKSAHGRHSKHHYYEHMRNPKADGISHKHRCTLERVRAERLEDIVLKSIQSILDTPAKLDEITNAYQKHTVTEIPGLEGRLKVLDSELGENEKRAQNLVTRLSDLPPEVSADPIYARLKELSEKKTKLAETRQKLESERKRLTAQAVDTVAFQAKLRAALATLRTTSESRRRPIYASVLKFAEIHPDRVKLGIYAPAMATPKNTNGTPGLLPRAGSTTVLFGAEGGTRTRTPLSGLRIFLPLQLSLPMRMVCGLDYIFTLRRGDV